MAAGFQGRHGRHRATVGGRVVKMSTITRLHAILAKFRDDKPEWRQSDLARALGLSQSTLSRNLATIVRTSTSRVPLRSARSAPS